MNIRSFSISSLEGEKPSTFFQRISEELEVLERQKPDILDIALEMPDSEDGSEQTSAAVYYKSAKNTDFNMRVEEFRFKNTHEKGLEESALKVASWLKLNDKVTVYNICTSFLFDSQYEETVLTRLYYSLPGLGRGK